MKAAQIILVIVGIGALINWVRAGSDWPVSQAFPLLSGDRPSGLFVAGGFAMLVIFVWGLDRLSRRERQD